MSYRILLATDGSENAQRAVRIAADLAHAYHGEVLVICVVSPVPALVKTALQAGRGTLNGTLSELRVGMLYAQRALKNATDALTQTGVRYSTRLDQGDPVERICDTARMEDCDVIVLGQHGLDHPISRTLGEVSSRISQCAPCAIVVVA